METEYVKFVVFAPLSHADVIRQALGEAGAGRIGDYDFSSFSTQGVSRFRGGEGTHPAIGQAGRVESVEEERIEAIVPRDILQEVAEKVRSVHPYEEVAFDIYPVEFISFGPGDKK